MFIHGSTLFLKLSQFMFDLSYPDENDFIVSCRRHAFLKVDLHSVLNGLDYDVSAVK